MHPRRLGEVTVTAVGCGAVSLARGASRGVDSREVEAALHAALELGVTLVDAAPERDSERLVGAAVRTLRLRDRVVTATTIPALLAGAGVNNTLHLGAATVGAIRATGARRVGVADALPPAYVVASVEDALRATKLDALPLVQLSLRAAWRSQSAWAELVGTAARLVHEGKVRQWGAVVDDLELRELTNEEREERRTDAPEVGALPLVTETWLASLQLTFNACERAALPLIAAATAPLPDLDAPDPQATPLDPVSALLVSGAVSADLATMIAASGEASALAAMLAPVVGGTTAVPSRHRPLIFARHPLAGGALAGALGPGAKLTLRDDRAELEPALLDRIAVVAARLTALVREIPAVARATVASRTALEHTKRREDLTPADSLAALALRYVLDQGVIALPRLHRRAHVPTAIAAGYAPPLGPVAAAALLEALR